MKAIILNYLESRVISLQLPKSITEMADAVEFTENITSSDYHQFMIVEDWQCGLLEQAVADTEGNITFPETEPCEIELLEF